MKICPKCHRPKISWTLIQGDSRKLTELLQQKNLVGITSPPYSEIQNQDGGLLNKNRKDLEPYLWVKRNQGETEGQISNLPDKKLIGITSPPFLEMNKQQPSKGLTEWGLKERPNSVLKSGQKGHLKYSNNPSNIGNLPDKKLVGITSSPFENQEQGHGFKDPKFYQHPSMIKKSIRITQPSKQLMEYGNNLNQIGNQQTTEEQRRKFFEYLSNLSNKSIYIDGLKNIEPSYLSEMYKVYEQASQLMPVIVTITKNPTRKGQLRRLDLDTAKLLMSCGYEIVDYHRSLLFEEKKQLTLSGNKIKQMKGRLSFFKRLSINKGNVASQWEDIIIGVKK